ncbi:cation transporter [Cryobacterium sp. PH31-O1]|uniref:cation transporter n=1 Tax=Cryobacterium sp. PH31-O1 TaxID=3046306 RepID=UPI0024B9664E|nr:cation transporter [Cryobacterium sp. PH31-O1]MDJ0338625.1 cation transporter [Cryobacterium sp. PH31-O1]
MRSLPLQGSAWSVVELGHDLLEARGVGQVEIRASGEVLAEQSVGVLVGAALPGRVRLAGEDGNPGGGGEVSVAVAWQFAAPDPEQREKMALRVIAFSFFALAASVTVDAGLLILGVRTPEHSPVGIVLAAVSLMVMPVLSWLERRTGRELGSASAVADSKQTLLCAYLSAAVLIGLLLDTLFSWAWADAVAALVIAGFAIREGVEAWKGDTCAAPVSALTGERPLQHDAF